MSKQNDGTIVEVENYGSLLAAGHARYHGIVVLGALGFTIRSTTPAVLTVGESKALRKALKRAEKRAEGLA